GGAAGLGRRGVWIGLARVRRRGIGLFVSRLIRRARAGTAQLAAQDGNRRIGIDSGLLGIGVRIGVLLRLADLDHVLLLAVTAAAREALSASTLLRRGCVLVGLAPVRRIGVGLVAGRLLCGARARAAPLAARDAAD